MDEKREKCKRCGAKMNPKTKRAEFCSPKCKVYWHRENIVAVTKKRSDKKKETPIVTPENKHRLWKNGDPREGSMAFYLKYDCYSYSELENKK